MRRDLDSHKVRSSDNGETVNVIVFVSFNFYKEWTQGAETTLHIAARKQGIDNWPKKCLDEKKSFGKKILFLNIY